MFFRDLLLKFYRVMGLLLILAAASVMIAQDDDHEPLFMLYSDEAVITHGPSPDWDGLYTDPGAVTYHDGQFHMFRNGFKGWPASVEIGYLTSEDGFSWTEVSEDPVLFTTDVPFAEVAALASSVVIEDDGTWVLYFYTWNTNSGGNGDSTIGRATAPDPLGPWTVHPEPVLTPGEAGAWDDWHVDSPSVVKTENGYNMYYGGLSRRGEVRIGLATSEDGITWTKQADPLMEQEYEWEGVYIHQPRVVQTPDGYAMVYRATRNQPRAMNLGLAVSADGENWTKYDRPIFLASDIATSASFWFTALAYSEEGYFLYIESDRGGGTNIFATSFMGELPVTPS